MSDIPIHIASNSKSGASFIARILVSHNSNPSCLIHDFMGHEVKSLMKSCSLGDKCQTHCPRQLV